MKEYKLFDMNILLENDGSMLITFQKGSYYTIPDHEKLYNSFDSIGDRGDVLYRNIMAVLYEIYGEKEIYEQTIFKVLPQLRIAPKLLTQKYYSPSTFWGKLILSDYIKE